MNLVPRIPRALAWVVVLGAGLGSGAVSAKEQSFRDWQVSCPGDGRVCTLSTTTFAEDRTWLSTLRLQPGAGHDPLPVQILVPPRVHLGSGLFVAVPGIGERAARYIRCSQQACDARIELGARDLSAWKRARAAQLLYRPSPTSPPIRFNVSLMGLTAAINEVLEGQE